MHELVAESLAFKAHARLLTMLGEQLIKNERIALVELVKNSYDADATRVAVDFRGFASDFSVQANSQIVITDNGSGMNGNVIRSAWMNPATPSKAATKVKNPVTPLGRAIQGEKGIGRFATFKLGTEVLLVSRAIDESVESTLFVDISDLNESSDDGATRLDYYLDDIPALFDQSSPNVFGESKSANSEHGTELRIGGLRAEWTPSLVRGAYDDIGRMQPLMWEEVDHSEVQADFSVDFFRDGVDMELGAQRTEEFRAVLDRAVLRVTDGHYDAPSGAFTFTLNRRSVEINIDAPEVRGLRIFREHFGAGEAGRSTLSLSCGSFGFEFFIFDFSVSAPGEHSLDREEKNLLKQHRVYLYRDGIRVYPYGDPGDDWLQVDAIRGTQSARSMFSNDQTVGYVTITQSGNPLLQDKTNREGLLETGSAARDFIALIQIVLAYLRTKPYEQYAAANRRVRERNLKSKNVDKHVLAMRQTGQLTKAVLVELDELEAAVDAERELSGLQVARTEQLAGVGLSVETASHDLIAAGDESLRLARSIVESLRYLDLMADPIFVVAKTLVQRLEFVSSRFNDVQGLFVSTRQKRTSVNILQMVRRVRSMYGLLHEAKQIEFEIDPNSKLTANVTEGAILQCLINLVDNATYWLMTAQTSPRLIRAFALDGRTLVVTDNGPGVGAQDEPFIFEPFYSGKGEAGKGLGLYIARQNGLRSGFDVQLESPHDQRTLQGATFVVRFGEEGDES